MANRPIKQYKAGNISGAIWFNEKEKDNQILGFKTVSIRRSWKDKDTWRDESLNLRKTDIPKVLLILTKIQEDLLLNQQEEKND
ncbi:hypothetical protein J4436_01065 [Candidatus Woesearchaeota archaeon]|nr:hypothetical protein [Candidatus Woesearchaeota archaeon]